LDAADGCVELASEIGKSKYDRYECSMMRGQIAGARGEFQSAFQIFDDA